MVVVMKERATEAQIERSSRVSSSWAWTCTARRA